MENYENLKLNIENPDLIKNKISFGMQDMFDMVSERNPKVLQKLDEKHQTILKDRLSKLFIRELGTLPENYFKENVGSITKMFGDIRKNLSNEYEPESIIMKVVNEAIEITENELNIKLNDTEEFLPN